MPVKNNTKEKYNNNYLYEYTNVYVYIVDLVLLLRYSDIFMHDNNCSLLV